MLGAEWIEAGCFKSLSPLSSYLSPISQAWSAQPQGFLLQQYADVRLMLIRKHFFVTLRWWLYKRHAPLPPSFRPLSSPISPLFPASYLSFPPLQCSSFFPPSLLCSPLPPSSFDSHVFHHPFLFLHFPLPIQPSLPPSPPLPSPPFHYRTSSRVTVLVPLHQVGLRSKPRPLLENKWLDSSRLNPPLLLDTR